MTVKTRPTRKALKLGAGAVVIIGVLVGAVFLALLTGGPSSFKVTSASAGSATTTPTYRQQLTADEEASKGPDATGDRIDTFQIKSTTWGEFYDAADLSSQFPVTPPAWSNRSEIVYVVLSQGVFHKGGSGEDGAQAPASNWDLQVIEAASPHAVLYERANAPAYPALPAYFAGIKDSGQ